MAAIESPRRILGERDVNKPVFAKIQSNAASPRKSGFSALSHNLDKIALNMAKSSEALLHQTLHEKSPSSASSKSPLGGRKRGVDCLTDIQDGPPQKQAVIALSNDSFDDTLPSTGEEESRHAQSSVVRQNANLTSEQITSSTSTLLRRSVSPDSSFDATQDSEILDSQLTNITEPEDIVAPGIPRFTTATPPAPRMVSQEDARENAEALRLRLRVAMYKIKTNQTDLPLSKLEIRSSKSHNLARTLLPTSRLTPRITPSSYPSQNRDRNRDTDVEVEDPTSAPSSPPPQLASPIHSHPVVSNPRQSNNIATPILPRSRDGFSHLGNRGSPEPGPEVTSSVVKGRAADGLLSLMGGHVLHRL